MKRIVAAALAAIVLPASAQAAIVIKVNQVGSAVVVTGSGSFDTSALKLYATNLQGSPVINPASGIINVGVSAPIDIYTGVTGPTLGFFQTIALASSATGDSFGFSKYLGAVYVPVGYVSGAALFGTSTYLNTQLSALHLLIGDYVFRSGTDTITVNIGTAAAAAAVPEPATWAMMIAGFGLMGVAARRRGARTKGAVAAA